MKQQTEDLIKVAVIMIILANFIAIFEAMLGAFFLFGGAFMSLLLSLFNLTKYHKVK